MAIKILRMTIADARWTTRQVAGMCGNNPEDWPESARAAYQSLREEMAGTIVGQVVTLVNGELWDDLGLGVLELNPEGEKSLRALRRAANIPEY
jgi:hypothetical protein